MTQIRLFGSYDVADNPEIVLSGQDWTAEPVKTNQIGLTTSAYTFVYKIFSDVVASSTEDTITLTTHNLSIGDIISITSGTLSGLQIKVIRVARLVNTLVNDISPLPSPGDTVDILRYRFPLTDASGTINVNVSSLVPISGHVITDSGSTTSATQGTSPWIVSGSTIVSGTVTANVAGLNAFQTTQYTVGTSAVQLTPSPLANRSGVSIKVTTTSSLDIVYIGNSSGVTTSTGYPLFNGDSIQLDLTAAHSIYAIGTTASQLVFVMEIGS